MLQLPRHRQEARRLVQADAEGFFTATSSVPRPMVRLASASATWSCPRDNARRPDAGALAARRVHRGAMTGKRVGVDTATRMANAADLHG